MVKNYLLVMEKPRKFVFLTYFGAFFVVRLIGLEPTRPESPDPKSDASTNSATSALYKRARFVNAGAKVQKKYYSTKSLRANSIKVSLPREKSSSV